MSSGNFQCLLEFNNLNYSGFKHFFVNSGGKHGVVSGSGSSRRKPVAPQWFNPSWHDDSDDEEVINGVCVFQNVVNYSSSSKEKPEPNSPSEATKPNKCVDSREGSIIGKSGEDEESHEVKMKTEKEIIPEENKDVPGAHTADTEGKNDDEKVKEEVESENENGD